MVCTSSALGYVPGQQLHAIPHPFERESRIERVKFPFAHAQTSHQRASHLKARPSRFLSRAQMSKHAFAGSVYPDQYAACNPCSPALMPKCSYILCPHPPNRTAQPPNWGLIPLIHHFL